MKAVLSGISQRPEVGSQPWDASVWGWTAAASLCPAGVKPEEKVNRTQSRKRAWVFVRVPQPQNWSVLELPCIHYLQLH